MPIEPGQRLAHYRIQRLLGRGGMGAVFIARDVRLERDVALKVLPSEMASSPERLERFRREARVLAALNHPHIVTIHSVEEADGIHFLTMELVDGDSLDRGLRAGGQPLATVLEIGIALADALAAAHEKGIIHRDLKPANVMVTAEGRVKVLDFGLAKLAPPAGSPMEDSAGASGAPTERVGSDRTLTGIGVVVGTVPYMSPEQVGGEAVDARTDIFSLGVMLYEMVTGRRPFGGKNPAETISSILRDEPRPVAEARHEAPRHLGRIIDHCLQKKPRDRYQSARDVHNELRALREELNAGFAMTERSSSIPGSTSSGTTSPASGNKPWIWAVGGVAVALVVILAFWAGGREGAAPVSAEMQSVAVLPFTNIGTGPEEDYFSDGLTEELISALVRIPDLRVAARTSSFAFKGRTDDLREIGRKLGVANILEGSVRRSQDRLRITAQLVKAEDGFHLWSEVYDREAADIFAIQGDVASRVARALSLELLPEQERSLTRPATTVPAAHQAYLKGRFHWAKRTVPDLRKAIEYLEEAVALDDGYAEAWLGLAEAWVVLLDYDPSQSVAQGISRGREASRRALALDPTLVEAHAALGMAAIFEWDWATAETELLRVIEERPSYASARHWYAWLLVETNRHEQAIEQIRRARDLDPLSIIINSNVGQMLFYAGRYDEAIVELKRCLELEPRFHLTRGHLAGAFSMTGRHEEAIGIFKDLLEEYHDADTVARLARANALAGNIEEAETLLERARTMGAARVEIASVLTVMGRTNDALTLLEQACAERESGLRALRVYQIYLGVLESEPRFGEILRCANLQG